jgi:hypothetical protein
MLEPAEIERLLIDFLIHAPNYTAAAGKLLLDISLSDLFEVGAVAVEQDANS